MSGFIEFSHYQSEALIVCLLASIVWAGVLFAGARGVERAGSMTSAEKLWVAALLFAVLPSLIAPTLAAFGVSLRPAPEPVVLESEIALTPIAAPVVDVARSDKPTFVSMQQIVGAAAVIYVYGVFLTLFLWAARNLGLSYAIARAERVNDELLLARIDDWADAFNVRRPTIKRSRHVSSVCIFGIARQTILIPLGIEARISSEDLVLMCAHELAHVRRGDTRLFTATQLARVLFWFNPLVARIAAHAELAAEESADALVLAKGADRRAYAACFVEGLKFAALKMNAQPALAPSFTPSDRNGRRRRLNSILSPEQPRKAPLATRLMLSAAVSTVALVAVGQAALAVDPASAGERRRTLSNLPLAGDIAMGFGERSIGADGKEGPAHNGLDIKAPKGAKVFAPGDGVVVEATDRYRRSSAWGKVVVIDHGHGLETRYAHLDSYSVRKGDRINAGDIIATVGATGKVTGPHLHFETLQDGAPVDPEDTIALATPDALDAPDPVLAPAPFDLQVPAPAPVPAAKPAPSATHATRFSFRIAPKITFPAFPEGRELLSADRFPDYGIVSPALAGAPLAHADGIAFARADGPDTAALMAEDMEGRLLGALDGENVGDYNLTLRKDGKVYTFSSNEPMTAKERAELREALQEMKRERERADREAEHARDEARREIERARREAAREREEARREMERAARENAEAFAWNEDFKAMQEEFDLSRREQLEIQREALNDARTDLEDSFDADLSDAMADFDEAERELDDAEMSRAEIEAARAAIAESRRQLERDGEIHKRAIEEARRQIDAQREQIDRMIEELDREKSRED
ncbi:MAG: peptidoglycan DD-metalloendopeptidase family protein [Pseudomonadota bacterium]